MKRANVWRVGVVGLLAALSLIAPWSTRGNKILGRTPIFVKGTKSFKATLPAGTYTFYCSVPGHRQAGMEGKLTITGRTP